MFETAFDVWLVVRVLISVALGVRTANRLRHDETSERAVGQMASLHSVAALVTWVLEALIRWNQVAAALGGPIVQVGAFAFAMMTTIWVPLVDALVFFAVSAVIGIALVRQRLGRYREELLLGEPEQRARAADACSFLGPLARRAVPELLQVVGDPDAELRFRTARALGRVWLRDTTEAKACLRRSLADGQERVRLMAACALALVKEADPPVVEGVLAALASDDEDLRGEAFRAVSVLGPAAAEVGAERVLALADHWKYTWSVPATLQKIGAPAVPALVVLLGHEKPRMRSAAANALGLLGSDAVLALPSLTASSKGDGNKTVRQSAKNAMTAITKKSRHARR